MQPMNIVLALAIFLNVALIGFLLIWIHEHKLPFAKPLAVIGIISLVVWRARRKSPGNP
jgi:hypothetical protein